MKWTKWLLMVSLLLALLLPAACGQSDVSFAITSPVDGLLSRTNVIKVEGTVPRGASAVTVNGKAAYVSAGAYFAFIELAEGGNIIRSSAVVNGAAVTVEANAVFKPPLAVFIDNFSGKLGPGSDTFPAFVTGHVSKPEANVTVNGESVFVQPDGTFSVQITADYLIRQIVAVAMLDGDRDIYDKDVFVSGGQLGTPPFDGSAPNFPILEFPRAASVKRGQDTVLEWTYQPKHNILSPRIYNLRATGSQGSTPGDFPLPDGLGVKFFPESFTAYPNCSYALSIIVTAGVELKPGIYQVIVHLPTAGGTISIEVL